MAEAFDTHKAYRELTADDRFRDEQAEALVQLVNGAITGNVATKSDIDSLCNELKNDIDSLRNEVKNDIDLLREETKTFKSELRGDMARFRLHVILWVLSGTGLLLLAREILANIT